MATRYYTEGNIHLQHIVEFTVLGKDVRFETNDLGTHVELWFDGEKLSDSFGECFTWKYIGHLHGAARDAAIAKQLRDAAESELAYYLSDIPNLYKRINELEEQA